MRIFAFIPARYGSSRFPGKPLAPIAGKPMIRHVYERALSCPELSDVYVVTDDERISNCVEHFGGKVVLSGGTHLCGTDRISEAALKMELGDEDLVVNIQGDQPLFHPALISGLIAPFLEDDAILMTTLKCPIRDRKTVQNPNHVKVVTDAQGFALYFSRSPIPFLRDSGCDCLYYKHLGFYGFRMPFLTRFSRLPQGSLEAAEKLEQLRAQEHGFKIKVVETPYDSIEIDVPQDIEKMEKMLAQGQDPGGL